jgi:DNA-binding FadR family transcriptional regulator
MSRPPLYERVESVLAGDIADGTLPPETQLPSEDGLIARFKVSRTTVRKAIQNLVERGLVEVRRARVMRRNLRLQPKTAFTRFPPVHAADPEGQQRVDLTRSQLVSGTVGPGAFPRVGPMAGVRRSPPIRS